MEAPLNAYGYLRCSGDAFLGETWARQEEAINLYARAHDIQIVEWFRDEWVPGKTELQNRPGLAGCMAAVEANGIKVVIVESADRLARDSMISELVVREFQKLGVRIIAASGCVDLTAGDDSNPTAKLVRQILAAVAEFDRCVIVLKLRSARERLRRQNGKCEGRKAYGTWNGNEASTVSLILSYARGGYRSDSIAEKLNAAGIKSRYGKRWHSGTVSKIIKRFLTSTRVAPDLQTTSAQLSDQKGISESLIPSN